MNQETKTFSRRKDEGKRKRNRRGRETLFQQWINGTISLKEYERITKERYARTRLREH